MVNWIDVFTRESYKKILVESLDFCIKEKGLSHIHLIASAREGFELAAIIRDFKKFTSRMVIENIETNLQECRMEWMVWMFKRAGAVNTNNKVTKSVPKGLL